MSRPRPKMHVAKHQHPGDGDGMLEIILQEMEGLPREKRTLIDATKPRSRLELGREAPGSAPVGVPLVRLRRVHQGSGHNADGSQRWLCKGCGRTFSARAGGCWPPQLDASTWGAFVVSTLAGRSRGVRRDCHVCLRTSWFMREALRGHGALRPPASGRGPRSPWQVDGTYLDESLAGGTGQERGRDAEEAPTGTAAPSTPGHLNLQGLRRLRRQRRGGTSSAAWRTEEAHGRARGGPRRLGAGTWVATDAHRG